MLRAVNWGGGGGGGGGGGFLPLGLPFWELLALVLTVFLFGWTLGGRLRLRLFFSLNTEYNFF